MTAADPTTSEIVSFATDLQDSSAAFYEGLAPRFPELADRFAAYAAEDRKGKTQIVRTYQETISDALEACFCFGGVNLADHRPDTTLPGGASIADSLRVAVALEEEIIRFYTLVAERSQALLATIPGVFKKVAATRGKRLEALRSLLRDHG